MQALLDRYVARLMFVPLAATLIVSAMLLLLIRMAELFDLIVNEGGGGGEVLRAIANLAPQYLAFAIPLGLLMAVLLAFRRLAVQSELDAMLGMGVSYTRLLKVPMLYAFGLSFLTFAVVGFIQPYSLYDHEKLLFDLSNGGLGISIRVGEFTSLGDKVVVRAEKSRRGGRDLTGVFATSTADDGRMLIFSAAHGELREADDGKSMIARLFDGKIVQLDPVSGENQAAGFKAYDIPLNLPPPPVFRERGNNERERTLPELFRLSTDPTIDIAERHQAEAGLYRRSAQIGILFFLPLIGISFARPPLRSASGLGVFLGLATFIIYNELSLFGERLGFTGQVAAMPAQAASFIPFAILCAGLYLLSAFLPGEPPLARMASGISRLYYGLRGAVLSASRSAHQSEQT